MSTHKKALVKGAVLYVALRWFIKGIGVISTIVLARFLSPSDYGVLVVATLVIGFAETFFFTGAETALLRNADNAVELINSTWTLRVMQACCLFTAVMLIAPFAADYFDNDKVRGVMSVLAFTFLIGAMGNLSTTLSKKNLDFELEIKIGIISKTLAFTVTVIAAYMLRNYWALVIGTIVGSITSVACGYLLHPYRPRWDTSRIREVLGFSVWLFVSNMGAFFGKKLDELILGKVGNTHLLGLYNVASDIGQTVTMEIGAPINRALFPVLSNLQGDKQACRNLFFSSLAVINTFTIPAGVGMALVAAPLIHVLLGPAWLGAIPILQIFAIQGFLRFLASPYTVWFMVINKGRMLAAMSWLEAGMFVVYAVFLYPKGMVGLAYARLLSSLTISVVWVVLGRNHGLPLVPLMMSVIRPIISVVFMALTVVLMGSYVTFETQFATLAAHAMGGALSYALSLTVVWQLFGRPDGIEKMTVNRLTLLHKKLRAK